MKWPKTRETPGRTVQGSKNGADEMVLLKQLQEQELLGPILPLPTAAPIPCSIARLPVLEGQPEARQLQSGHGGGVALAAKVD